MYVLENSLQAGHIHHKCTQRSKVGIYLGRSPQHARSVALVIDRNTGLVSPQFHLSFDPSFNTVKQDKLESMWKMKARFVTQREPSKPAKEKSKRNKVADTSEHPQGHKRKRTALNGNERETPQDRANLQHRRDPLPSADNPEMEKDTPVSDTPPGKDIQDGSKSTRQPVKRLIEAMMEEMSASTSHDVEDEIFCLSAMFPKGESLDLEDNPLLAFKAHADPDKM